MIIQPGEEATPGAVLNADCQGSSTSSSQSVPIRKGPPATPASFYQLDEKKRIALDAEIRYSLKVVEKHFSFRSCDDIKFLFRAMFPNYPPLEYLSL